MCLITFALQAHSDYPFILIANRDEFYERPTASANFWEDYPQILAGRDLKQKGTWLGITKSGKLAAITNFRDPSLPETGTYSRGKIPTDYLGNNIGAEQFLINLKNTQTFYAGYNALFGNFKEVYTYNNFHDNDYKIQSGIHSLSNDQLNTPWPKVIKAKSLLSNYLQWNHPVDSEALFNLLQNVEKPSDNDLPNTGIDLELERELSPIFIHTDNYGTRASTVILVDKNNHVTFMERSYKNGMALKDKKYHFSIDSD